MPRARLAGIGIDSPRARRAAISTARRATTPTRVAPVGLAAAQVADRPRGLARGGGDGRQRLRRGEAAGDRLLGARRADDRRRDGGERDPAGGASCRRAASTTSAAAPTTAISIARRYSSRTYALPEPGGGRRAGGRPRTARRRAATVLPGPVHSSSTGSRARVASGERSSTSAPSTTSGAPVSIAGEPFMTLPPSVPTLRVDGDPTSAEPSASALKRAPSSGLASMSACRTSAPMRDAAVVAGVDRRRARAAGRSRRAPRAAAPCPGARRRRGRCRRRRRARRRPRPRSASSSVARGA